MQDEHAFSVQLNGHSVSIIMREAVRRAINVIRAKRFSFESQQKHNLWKEEDFVTDADRAAQDVYVKMFSECFPDFGIIAEEDALSRACQIPEADIFITVDPLDGTKAFIRRQSHGISTMVSLVADGKVVSAYIGDINTQEIYGYRPGSESVHRLSLTENLHDLSVDPSKKLLDQYVLLRDPPEKHSDKVRHMLGANLFKSYEVGGGSIGISFTRLWNSEIGGVILRPNHTTPWDFCPILGICQKLGFVFLEIDPSDAGVEQLAPVPSQEIVRFPNDILVVYASRIEEVLIALKGYNPNAGY